MIEIGLLVYQMCQKHPGRLGRFIKDFKNAIIPQRVGGERLRDILPLPEPAMPHCEVWQSRRKQLRRHRGQRERVAQQAAEEVWTYLVVMGLNYLYCGTSSPDQRKHHETLTPSQGDTLSIVREAVTRFIGDPLEMHDIDDNYKHESSESLKMTTVVDVRAEQPRQESDQRPTDRS